MKTKNLLVMAILACAALSVITPAIQPAGAAGPWYVAPGGSDTNTCTTPSAACATINGALSKPGFGAGDTIRVAIGVYTGIGSQVVLLDKNVTLSGGWDVGFNTQSGVSVIDGQGTRRGMLVNSELTVVVEHFTIQNGWGFTNGEGGGIFKFDGSTTLTLNNSIVSNNIAGIGGGGIYNGGGGALILNNSVISNNTAGNGGGIGGGGGSTLTLNNSTVSNNTATGYGGGIYQSASTLNNSTISNNVAHRDGGGIYQSASTLNNSTISNNLAYGSGGGIYYGYTLLRNSILAGNTASIGPDCYIWDTAISSSGYNLVGNTSGCTFTPATGDLANVDPKLGPLEGSPGYHPLPPDSPAVNGGNPAGCTDHLGNPLTADQRGLPRFGRCDIGAYELQPFGFSALTVNRSGALPGDLLTYTIALNNAGTTDITNVQVTDTLPISLSYINNSLTATSGSYGYQNGVITWTGTVNAGGAVTITYRATVNPTLGFIVNSAVISGGGDSFIRTATVTVDGPICNLSKHTGNPVLALGAGGRWDDNAVWGPVVLKEGSSYKMWYTGADGTNPSRIGMATSTDGTTWMKAAANPVLSPSEAWWETKGIRVGSVISDGGLYKMWYTGFDSSGISRIGYATSLDGVAWTRYDLNPVLSVGDATSWEDEGVSGPTVIKDGHTYHLWYSGDADVTLRIGHATSSDGINWIKDLANPVLDIGSPGAWDWLNVYGPSVVKVGAEYKLWYSGQTLPEAWQTGYARSSNGSAWTRGKMLIPEGPSGAFDADSADYPSVMVDGDKFKVWYSGLNNGGDYTIGYATAEICSGAGVPSSHPIYLPIVVKSPPYPCAAYYTDNFSDPASGWPVDDNSSRRYAYTGGQYQIWVKEPSAGWWATPGAKAMDFTASVSARRTSGALGAYGIRFGISEAPGSQFYEFIVEDTYYSIWRYDNDSGSWTALRDWTASSHINTGTNWNRLKVVRNGASIAVYVNNQLLATVSDSNFTGLGRIGLVAYSPDNGGLDARFDDFSLYPASCGAGAARAAGVGFEMGEPGGYEAPVPPGLGQLR